MNHVTPAGPVQAYKTYAVHSPITSHFRDATCQEIECGEYASGWITMIDVATKLGRNQANYIRLHSGRAFTVTEVGTLVTFTFPPGQKCFAQHKIPLDRPEIYTVRGGDWRATTSPARIMRTDDWVDDFANHQDKLKTRIERG